MKIPLLRPKIERTTEDDVETIRTRLEYALDETSLPIVGDVFSDHAEFRFVPAEVHFWSPQLKLVFDGRDDRTRIHGRVGPQPNVWTLFLAGYAFCAIIVFAGFMIGSSQWLIGQPATGLWFAAAGMVVALVEYLVGLSGRRLGADQTAQLRAFVDRVFPPDDS
jgi:hypothetical protein